MGYVDDNLVPGESVAYRANLHWFSFAPMIAGGTACDLAGVGFILATFLTKASGPPPVWMIGVGALLMLAGSSLTAMGIVLWRSTEITVTTRRVFIKTGIVARHTTEILLSKVESVSVEESLWGRMFGYGRATIHGTGGTPEHFERIARPHEFRRQIQVQIEALSNTRRAS